MPTTPYLEMDLDVVGRAYRTLTGVLPGVTMHYAVKCNPDPRVLRHLAGLGCRFEIASAPELEMLLELGVDPREVLFSNPVKPPGTSRPLSRPAFSGTPWTASPSWTNSRLRHRARRSTSVSAPARPPARSPARARSASTSPPPGTSCAARPPAARDSQDTVLHDGLLSDDIAVGDTVRIHSAGAYTTSCASRFNGFDLPSTVTLQNRL
jgi:hypothetical protein